MYSRLLTPPEQTSYFLLGPRGTGKSFWVKNEYPNSIYINLLKAEHYQRLLSAPQRLLEFIPDNTSFPVIIDEVQKIPELLNEVHNLIEERNLKFILTGSSARALKRRGVNLLAGRARTRYMFPLVTSELQKDFNLDKALNYGMLPSVYTQSDPIDYLHSYITTYLKEEVQQEGLTRNLGNFSRFLEAASFSQASVLNIASVARDCSINRKLAEAYFVILEDLLLAQRIPVFSKRAKRDLVSHPKFFFFDTGVYRSIRPSGPLDSPEEISGVAMETLLYQELRALNSYGQYQYEIFYWQTRSKLEVDFVLYGPKGIIAFEVKHSDKYRSRDSKSLKAFLKDYPTAKAILINRGKDQLYDNEINIMPAEYLFKNLDSLLANPASEF